MLGVESCCFEGPLLVHGWCCVQARIPATPSGAVTTL